MLLHVDVVQARRTKLDAEKYQYFACIQVGKYSSWLGSHKMESCTTSAHTMVTQQLFSLTTQSQRFLSDPIKQFPGSPSPAPQSPSYQSISWDESRVIQVDDAEVRRGQVRVKFFRNVWHGKETVGIVAIKLYALSAGYPVQRWFPMASPNGNTVSVGELQLRLWLVDELDYRRRNPDNQVPTRFYQLAAPHDLTWGCCCMECDPNLLHASAKTRPVSIDDATDVAEEIAEEVIVQLVT